MDNSLVLTVLVLTLSWTSGTSSATNSTTASPASHNMTTNNMTTNSMMTNSMMTNNMTTNSMMTNNMTTMPPHNMTTMPPHNMTTMPPHNMTTNNMTTNSMMTNNMTTMPPHNMTTMPPHNMTTMPPHNMTMSPDTVAPTTATAATTAVVATNNTTLITNTTVIVLPTPIDRTGCGAQQICGSQPSACDPSSSSSCFFVAAKQKDGQNFEFSISGESSGYIAATVSADTTVGGNDTTYICANNNGKVKFFSALLDNNQLTVKELPVNSVKGRVNGNLIQCTFVATLDLSTTRAAAAATSASLSLSTGTFDSGTEALGTPDTKFRSGVVDLSNANATITNELSSTNTTTVSPTVTDHASTFQQSLMQVLLISVGVFTMALV